MRWRTYFYVITFQVYTVGPDYAHAEARKAPALDGKVERDKDGKEVRYPIILTGKEKLIARKVCLAFKVRHLVMIFLKNKFIVFVSYDNLIHKWLGI